MSVELPRDFAYWPRKLRQAWISTYPADSERIAREGLLAAEIAKLTPKQLAELKQDALNRLTVPRAES